MFKSISIIRTAIAFAACVSLFPAAPAQGAEDVCRIAQQVPGGMLRLVVTGSPTEISAAAGSVELYTAAAPPPLGLRDGSYTWQPPRAELAQTGGVFGLQFDVSLPISDMPEWGTTTGNLVPTRLITALPLLSNPEPGPIQFSNLVLISGNGLYNTTHEWSMRAGDNGLIITNAPDPLSLVYSRELLQLISPDPNEPISVFLTPAITGGTDSIASFYAGGLIEAPSHVATMLALFAASNGDCTPPVNAVQADTVP